MVHREGGDVPREVEDTDTLPILRNGTYHGFDDGTHMAYAWYGALN